jgi:aldose 1-epimerase
MSNYSAQKIAVDGIEVVRLADTANKTYVSIVPSVGNFAYEMNVNGHNVLWWPYKTLTEFRANPGFAGVPFLAPWANRLDQDAFWANGKKYLLNPDLGNFRRDQNRLPIHGLVSYATVWQVAAMKADENGAEVTSRLEFWRQPEWIAQFPFAHTIEMTYRLSNGTLEVRTVVENLSSEPLPLAIGYHPYYQITDAPRDQWKVHLAAKDRYELSGKLIPTGATKPIDLPDPVPLAGHQLDDVFGGLNHADEFWVQGARQKISIRYGSRFTVAVVYAPSGKDFICFEPMAAITNAFNLSHSGEYQNLQSIPPGAKWQESFWIRPSGF